MFFRFIDFWKRNLSEIRIIEYRERKQGNIWKLEFQSRSPTKMVPWKTEKTEVFWAEVRKENI